jgi:hypothetical protein
MENPGSEIEAIVSAFLNDDVNLSFISGNKLNMEFTHSVGGSPSRFKTGSIELKQDDKWRKELSKKEKDRISLLTSPLRNKYKIPN